MPLPLLLAAALAGTLCDRIAALTQAAPVARAHWGVSVTTATGTPLCGLNDAQYFRPASNAKLFTAAAALALLGPESTVTTRVTGSAPVAGEVNGDLTLTGSGDAYLSTRPMPYTRTPPAAPVPDPLAELADTLVARGVKHVTGGIVGDDTAFPYEPYAPDWTLDDTLWGYGAPVSALSVYDNKTALTVTPGAQPGMPATAALIPADPLYTLDLHVVTVGAKQPAAVRVDRAPGTRVVHLNGTVALGAPYTDDLAIDDPAEYTAATFKAMLMARGIAVDGPATAHHAQPVSTEGFQHAAARTLPLPAGPTATALPTEEPLAAHTSPSLAQDVTVTLKVSQNLHAELLLHRLGARFAEDGSTAQGVRVVEQFLRNAGVTATADPDVLLYDGSGLSGHDLATPRALTRLLAFAARQSWGPVLRAALPVGGVDGSLAGRFPALKGRVEAKTGTLGESRALSGYATTSAGETRIFAVMVDTHTPLTTADRDAMDRIVEAIAAMP